MNSNLTGCDASTFPRVLGWDIGGANLKQSLGTNQGWCVSFPLWKHPSSLAEALRQLRGRCTDSYSAIALTMTGELADCFENKRDGVCKILEQARRAADDVPVWVWSLEGTFLTIEQAHEKPENVAAANWWAQAVWVSSWWGDVLRTRGHKVTSQAWALLLDLGSTTLDLIPLGQSYPLTQPKSDLERLLAGELVYRGSMRTPLCSVIAYLNLRGKKVVAASEWFATMRDVYILLGELTEAADDHDTADGRPATKPCAAQRIARMLCSDQFELSHDELLDLARQWKDAHHQILEQAIFRHIFQMSRLPAAVVLTGSGEKMLEQVCLGSETLKGLPRISLASQFSTHIATTSGAVAVAELLRKHLGWTTHESG